MAEKAKKTILVTGGAGFVGSHLCERLAHDGHRVISLDNYFTGSRNNHVKGVEYHEGHTKDIEEHIKESPDIVFHLGEYSRVEKSFEDIEKVWDLNKHGTFAVLEFCRKRGSKIVYAGSSTKFGDDGLGRDQSPYAWVKATNTELVRNYGAWFGIPYAITYFYNVYGPREIAKGPYATVIGIFKEEYKNGQPLTVVSPGTQTRNFTHVLDIVDGLVRVGERGNGDEYGIGNERAYSINEIAELFGGERITLPERRGNRLHSPVKSDKTKALGWKAAYSLTENIKEFKRTTPRKEAVRSRILVFTTTFYPHEGPAEKALRELMERLPNVYFDIITTRFAPDTDDRTCPAKNAAVHRVGNGNTFDKYLLPVLGARKARELFKKHTYLFAWSLLASYGALAALRSRKAYELPVLITLADQQLGGLSWPVSLVLKRIIRDADQVYASFPEQERHLMSLKDRTRTKSALGAGDAFVNQIRFTYTTLLQSKDR